MMQNGGQGPGSNGHGNHRRPLSGHKRGNHSGPRAGLKRVRSAGKINEGTFVPSPENNKKPHREVPNQSRFSRYHAGTSRYNPGVQTQSHPKPQPKQDLMSALPKGPKQKPSTAALPHPRAPVPPHVSQNRNFGGPKPPSQRIATLQQPPSLTSRFRPSYPTKVGSSRYSNERPARAPIKTRRVLPSYVSTTDRIESIYKRIIQVGEGTYGKVYKSMNNVTGKLVALKKLRLQGEREGFPITSIREIKLLQSFDHPNVSTVKEIMVELNKVVYMIFEYADNDLSGLLLNSQININGAQCKDLFQQLLKGMAYLHDNDILHRDVKGSNILINNRGNLKITDFGLARKMKPKVNGVHNDYTNRVITLWYRPVELLLGTTNYSTEVDMWGCGCLLVELFHKTAIFQGSNELDQLEAIFKVLGTPSIERMPQLFEMPWFFMIMPQQKNIYPDQFSEKFGNILPTQHCYELARGLLSYDQTKRLTATQALESEYFTEQPAPEPLVLDELVSCHEFEVKLLKKQKKKAQQQSK